MTTVEIEMERLLGLGDKARLKLLYESYFSSSLSSDDSESNVSRKAVELFRMLEKKAQALICKSDQVNKYSATLEKDNVVLALLICDALAMIFNKPTAFILAAQIASIGIRKFCRLEE